MNASESPLVRSYAVFISYRHADNKEMGRKWANWLHEALESYEIPSDLIGNTNLRGEKVPASLYPVFRDEEELPADADLSTNIRRALENSGLLVVLCSPRAVQSRFVADEIRYFKELGQSQRILALIIDGEPNAQDDPEKQRKFGTDAECFPEPLRFGVSSEDDPRLIDWTARTEPIAADVRPGGRCEQGWTTTAAYEESQERMGLITKQELIDAVRTYGEQLELAKLKILAGAIGVPLGELTRRDKARQLQRAKKRAKILIYLSTLFGFLAICAGLAGWLAVRNEKRAVKAEDIAVTEKNRAQNTLALSYHDRSVDLLKQGDWRAAMTYCAKAIRIQPHSPLHSSMGYSLLLNHAGNLPTDVPWESALMSSVAYSPTGTHALMSTGAAPLLGDFITGKVELLKLPADSSGVSMGGAFSETGACCVADGRVIYFWDDPKNLLSSPPAWSVTLPLYIPARGSASPFGAAFMPGRMVDLLQDVPGGGGQMTLFNTKARTVFQTFVHQQQIEDSVVVSGTDMVASISDDKMLAISSAVDGRVIHQIKLAARPKCLAASGSSGLIAIGYSSPRIQVFNLQDPGKTWDVKQSSDTGSVATLAFTADGARLAAGFRVGGSGLARIWDAATGEPLSSWISTDQRVQEVCFDPKGERLAVLSDDAKVSVHDGGGRRVAAYDSGRKGGSLAFVRDGEQLAVASDDLRLQTYTTEPVKPIFASKLVPDEIGDLAITTNENIGLIVTDHRRDLSIFSIDNLAVIKSGIKPSNGDIHTAGIMKPAAEAFVVIITSAGSVEVCKLNGEKIAERPAPLTLNQISSIDTTNPLAVPESIEISFGGGDAAVLDAARSRVIVATTKMNVNNVMKKGAEIQAKGGGDEDLIRMMWEPSNNLLSGELLFLEVPSLKVLDRTEMSEGLISPRISEDGKCCIATFAGSGAIGIWCSEQGSWQEFENSGHKKGGQVNALITSAISAKGSRVIAVNADGTRVLDLNGVEPKWQEIADGEKVQNISFSPDEKLVALEVSPNEFSGVAQIWDLETLKPRSALLKMEDDIRSMEFSPDSGLLLTCSDDDTVRLWDATTGRPAIAPIRTSGDVRSAHFIRKGNAIVFGGQDRKLYRSAVPPQKPAPSWLPNALESFGGGALDDKGNERPVSGRLLFQMRQSMLAPEPGVDPWNSLARFFWRDKGAQIPECPLTPSSQMTVDCLDIWNLGDHSTTVARLREILRTDRDALIPGALARPAALARLERGGFRTLDQHDSHKAGALKEGPAGIEFRWCPPGQFMMGSPARETGRGTDETKHQVSFSRGFWMSETEVTQGQWEQVMKEPALEHMLLSLTDTAKFPVGKSQSLLTCAEYHGLKSADELKAWKDWLGAEHPMFFVTWSDAQSFCERLSTLMPSMNVEGPWGNHNPIRLPTEAEWEYACRAGTATSTYAGDPEYPGRYTATLLGPISWYSGNASDGVSGPGLDTSSWQERESSGPTAAVHPVAMKKPNAWGLHDMLGNVNEWCLESYRERLIDGEVDPSHSTREGVKSVRGGAFTYAPQVIRAARRLSSPPTWRSSQLGFRVVLLDGIETGTARKAGEPGNKLSDGSEVGSTFHFGEGDDARVWTREETNIWTEGYPDEHKDRFIVVNKTMLDGSVGEIARKQVKDGDQWRAENNFEVFLPRLNAPRPRIWFRRRGDDGWADWSLLSDVNLGKP
jgi:formylglycine-generating enzyme required for sulfatase activity/WD40 repeat protein